MSVIQMVASIFNKMNLFQRIFTKEQSFKECPRCLGKGHVDLDDINRLNQELMWAPGICAYCNGKGKVDSTIEENVPVNASYLVVNLPEDERKRIIHGHPDAIERGKQFEDQIKVFIDQISYLHFKTGLNELQIAEFFLLGKENLVSYEKERKEFVDYVERVIKKIAKRN